MPDLKASKYQVELTITALAYRKVALENARIQIDNSFNQFFASNMGDHSTVAQEQYTTISAQLQQIGERISVLIRGIQAKLDEIVEAESSAASLIGGSS